MGGGEPVCSGSNRPGSVCVVLGWGYIINAASQRTAGTELFLRSFASLIKMKLPGQEECDTSAANENISAGELDSDHGPGHSPSGSSETNSRELGVSRDPPLFIQLNELLGWPQALEWRETGR